jgi:HK97 family phage major capsid protein
METIQQLQERLNNLVAQVQQIEHRANDEERELTDAEEQEIEKLQTQFNATEKKLSARQASASMSARMNAPEKRVTQPTDTTPKDGAEPERARITGGDKPGATKGSWGWQSFGEYARAIKNAADPSKGFDNRLMNAASTYGNEATNADGGFAVPPDFRAEIVKKVQGEESLLSMTDQQTTSSNKLTVPLDNTTPWQTSGGILAAWEDEAAVLAQTKPALGQLEVKANKLFALVPMTDEIMEDAPSLSRYLPGKVADKFTSKINDAIVNGGGNGRPQGLLNAASKVTVNKEGGQATGTIVFNNIVKMWSRMYAPLRRSAVWLINQDIEPQLLSMVAPGAHVPGVHAAERPERVAVRDAHGSPGDRGGGVPGALHRRRHHPRGPAELPDGGRRSAASARTCRCTSTSTRA